MNSINVDHLFQPQPSDPVATETDIRIRWEPARLQHALALPAYAHHHHDGTGLDKAGQASKGRILSWLMANPFPMGEHYQSAMECALRVPVFFYALKRLDNLTSDEYHRMLKAIYLHGWLISKKLSLYSSLGNHTIAEAVGLVFAGAVFRSTRRGKDWLGTGIKLLNDELARQVLDDGGPAEQSLAYHRFVLDLYWLAMDFIQKNNLGNIRHWQKRLVAGEVFLETFKNQNRLLPAIGDSDDGYAVAPGIAPRRIAPDHSMENFVTFPDSGYTVIRNDNLVFTLDHGPLGMPPLYNHGHADALSITLSKNGRPMLVDPGTYRYNGVPQWRKYFKGTRAHNTVTIDDQDQAVQETG
ncbi:MAG: alginate lyase family protein, partial [Bacteroidales bacterium]